MGEEETVTEVAEAVANGTTIPDQKAEDVPEVKEEEMSGLKEMEEDGKDDEKAETHQMDVDPEGKETKEVEEKGEQENKEEEEEERNEARSEAMEEETEEIGEKIAEKEEEERAEESKQEKVSKRRRKRNTSGINIDTSKEEVEGKAEQKTPVGSGFDRPVRERKSVERLVAVIEKDSNKEFYIEKGKGTALKDIPNVAYKLSRRKSDDDTLKLLHMILFGRRGKAVQVKSNIFQFSGFVWNRNEEKQKMKVKEKVDKCVKEKLLEICDVLDVPIAKATTRKEDIVTKLIDFLVAPLATTDELLAEKEQSSKGKKRKRDVKSSPPMSGSTSSKHSSKSGQRTNSASKEREKYSKAETEDEFNEEEEEEGNKGEKETVNGVPDHSESEEGTEKPEDEIEEDTVKDKGGSKKSSAKKESAGKAKTKKVATLKISSPAAKGTPVKSSSKSSKVDNSSDTTPKTFSRKKKTEVIKEKSSTPKKSASVEKIGKNVAKGKVKPKEEKLRPSDDQLRNAICEILKEVDFNTATFTDILKLLAGRFKMDLIPRKSAIKLIIQDELTKLADEAEDEEGEDDAQPSAEGVEA